MTNGVLISQHGGTAGHVLAFSEGVVIGRGADCSVPIPHPSVSRRHARIERRGGEFIVIDCDSHNGTRVNGVSVARRVLHEGDLLTVGEVGFTFHEADEEGVEAPELTAGQSDVGDGCPTVGVVVAPPIEKPDVRALNAWQIVRAFVRCVAGGEEALLRRVAEDLSGIRGIHRVIIYARPGVIAHRARWIKGGDPRPRLGVALPDERLISVAESGTSVPERLSGSPTGSSAGMAAPEVVCVPVRVGGVSRCALYVESADRLAWNVLQAVLGIAEALGVGLAIRGPIVHPRGRSDAPPVVEIVGRSEALRRCIDKAQKAAQADSTVLLRGESGTGKELFARLIYSESRRKGSPFITVHSSAIEETLLGSALFGHEKGAFTGAVGMRHGLFEDADGGTLFLDEVGEIGLAAQVKLLRVLQEGEFLRLGGNRPIRVDVRIIAATNQALERLVREGAFREDLYYRLNVIELTLPPLRERKEDIPELVNHFVGMLRRKLVSRVTGVSEEAMAVLTGYDWPGNVRELRNVIERALVLADGPALVPGDLPAEMVWPSPPAPTKEVAGETSKLEDAEFLHIRRVLEECGGNKKEAAMRLGISRSTLYEKMRGI